MGGYRNQEGDYDGAIEYLKKAAGLGDLGAHYELSVMYRFGHGVVKDKKKEVYHLEKAAIGGVPFARHNLGIIENENGRPVRATKHFIIATKLGYDASMKTVKEGFKGGLVSKEDFAAALRGHQAAVDATKSPQRDEAELARKL
jgi:TPR repeat protein